MIVFENVKKRYEDGFEAIKGISFMIQKGELVTIIGPSGCGKTTALKMINKLIEPSDGTILVNGEDIQKKDPVELRRNIGYVIQQIGLIPHMTIAENISLIPKLKGWKKEKYEKRVDELLEIVGLDSRQYRNKYPLELSGGQQQRVGVVRALAAEPPIVLMDEPFSSLDPISREQLQEELKGLQKKIKKTIVFVTHDMDEALKISDRIAIMKEGRIIQFDTPQKILQTPANDFVQEFIGNRINPSRTSASSIMTTTFPCASMFQGEIHNMETEGHVLPYLFVVNENEEYVGYYEFSMDKQNTSELMGKNVYIHEDTSIQEAVRLLMKYRMEALPILNESKLIGVVTKDAILSHYAQVEVEGM
jgi:osmoprotectant transport system ATP-binding protein